MTREEVVTFCRIVGSLLVSDYVLHDAEVRYLDSLYTRHGVSEEERARIEAGINLTDDVGQLARSLSVAARVELLEELNQAAWADGIVVPQERRIIHQIETLLSGESADTSPPESSEDDDIELDEDEDDVGPAADEPDEAFEIEVDDESSDLLYPGGAGDAEG